MKSSSARMHSTILFPRSGSGSVPLSLLHHTLANTHTDTRGHTHAHTDTHTHTHTHTMRVQDFPAHSHWALTDNTLFINWGVYGEYELELAPSGAVLVCLSVCARLSVCFSLHARPFETTKKRGRRLHEWQPQGPARQLAQSYTQGPSGRTGRGQRGLHRVSLRLG